MSASFSTTTATTGAATTTAAGGGAGREVGVVSPRVALPQASELMERSRPGLTGHGAGQPPPLAGSAFLPQYGRLPGVPPLAGVHGYGGLRPPAPPPPPPPAYGWLPTRLSGDNGEEYDRALQRYSRAHADLALRQHWLHTFRQNVSHSALQRRQRLLQPPPAVCAPCSLEFDRGPQRRWECDLSYRDGDAEGQAPSAKSAPRLGIRSVWSTVAGWHTSTLDLKGVFGKQRK